NYGCLGRLSGVVHESSVRKRTGGFRGRRVLHTDRFQAYGTLAPMTTTLVLVVDDEPAMLKVSEMTLLGAGYSVLTFDDPIEALQELHDGLRPDVVVSDVSMPQMDGFAFYGKVRDIPELRAVPFLFLTALEDRG